MRDSILLRRVERNHFLYGVLGKIVPLAIYRAKSGLLASFGLEINFGISTIGL
jgi:hypothetical protein